ncbi:MAG: EamA family transporter [Candidatus Auribacterota bacterium]|nr:EamA family transporter [Candidatus Auribacterota bacterium]
MIFSFKNTISGTWFVLFAAMLWGTTGTAQGLAPVGANPMTVGAIRLAIGGFSLLIIAIARKQLFSGKKWPLFTTFITAFFIASYQLCFFAAVAKTGVAVGTMVAIGSSPVAAGILGFLIRKEKLERMWYLATFLAVMGCILLSLSGGQLSLNLAGIVLALGAGFSYAMYTVTIKGLLDEHSPDAVMAIVFSLAAILLTPTFFLYDWRWMLHPQGFAVALHLGIITAALSYWLFARGLKSVKVGHVATLSLAEPLTASLLGVFILHESLGAQELLGICLIFAGIVFLAIAPSK